jgi:hypothetical protein
MNPPLHKLKSSSKTQKISFGKAFVAAGLLSGAVFSSLGFTPAAQAFTGNLAGLAASGPFSVGDKTYSDFSYTGFAGTDTVNVNEVGPVNPQHTLNLATSTGMWGIGTYTLTYKLKVKAPSTNLFSLYRNQVGSAIFGTNKGTYQTAFSGLMPVTATAPVPVTSNINGGPSPIATFSPLTDLVTEATFTNTLIVTEGGATVLDNTLVQAGFSSDTGVPGPLPLLGAGAAFGFSRRIRSRIKASA